MAMVFAHPWRSAVVRCVTSKKTDLAEDPKPSHVVKANGRTPTPSPHTRGHPRALSGFRPGCSASQCAPRPGDVVPPTRRMSAASCRRGILLLLPLPRCVVRIWQKKRPGRHCAFVSCRCVRSTQNDLRKGPRCLCSLDIHARLCLAEESTATATSATVAGTPNVPECPGCLSARHTANPSRWGTFGKLCGGPARIHWRRPRDSNTCSAHHRWMCGQLVRMQVF